MKTVGVEFKKNGKEYTFFDNNFKLNIGNDVIVETERGLQFGKVASLYGECDTNIEHTKVFKIATEKDKKQYEANINDALKAKQKAQEIAQKMKLDMKFLDTYYTFDRKQLVFQFFADNRVDFRELAKSLAAIYKTRIELRQVGVRDKAKEVSGIGPCGRKLCCSAFLNDIDSVSISQVKNQNLAPNPTKINGLCGRLLCCLKFEDDLYTEYRKDLPEVGDKINTNGSESTVITLDIPQRKYTVIMTEDGSKVEVKVPLKKEQIKENNDRRKNKRNK